MKIYWFPFSLYYLLIFSVNSKTVMWTWHYLQLNTSSTGQHTDKHFFKLLLLINQIDINCESTCIFFYVANQNPNVVCETYNSIKYLSSIKNWNMERNHIINKLTLNFISFYCSILFATWTWTSLNKYGQYKINQLFLLKKFNFLLKYILPQFSSVAQLCPTLCDPMNRSTPGLPVHYQLPEFTETHVHWVGDAIQPSHPLLSPSLPAPKPS